jgi:UDP:flavonoid glycosyltransferase YjiC (YdhE family)
MRALFASTRGAGHFHPLVPFADAWLRRGHDLLFCGPPSLREAAEGRGCDFWPFDEPPADEVGAVWARVPALSPDEQNEVVIREVFGRLDTGASLPRLRDACREWRPDVVVREVNEYGSALAAELHGLPHARVAVGLSAMEEQALSICAVVLDELRGRAGLPADPNADALRRTPYMTLFPSSFEDPAAPGQPCTLRFRDPAWDLSTGDAWLEEAAPLVYMTFGSVAGAMPMAAHLYVVALEAVGGLPVRVVLTVGRGADPEAFADAPANVRVEPWVPQAEVLAQAGAVVCHAGSGSTLGALAAGVPLVAVPLFADQPFNARRIAATGAGLVAAPEPGAIRAALRRVLDEEPYRAAARALAAELRSHPPTDAAVDGLVELAGSRPAAEVRRR